MKLKSEGLCGFCKKTFAGKTMANHLKTCKERAKTNSVAEGSSQVFLLKASAGPFFVYFEAEGSTTLKKVDSFLRGIWLECCGHLSMFMIRNSRYAIDPQPEYDDISMNVPIARVLAPNLQFSHEYDFGTTTALAMKCVSVRTGKSKGVQILARNDLPKFDCSNCNKPAKDVCSQCIYESDPLFCKQCAKKHECGEEMLLPVVNSPRMGMCGYTG